jgi:2-methylcitrate dehydratase PrpD
MSDRAADDGQSLTEALVGLLGRPIAAQDRRRASLHVLDWLGCAMAGATTEIGQKITAMTGTHPFALAGHGTDDSVLALGSLGSLLEMDDVHRGALLHPGPVVVPVVLGLVPEDPLAALVHGYEAMIRLGRSVGASHYAVFHNTSTCGGIGSAVAAGRAHDLGPAQMVSAIGHAMSLSAGLWQCRNEPVATKHLHVAEASRRGVAAARYAKAGLAGPRFILEGPQGFFVGMAPDGSADRVTADRTAPWALHDVSYKPWPACRHAHPAIDAALVLRNRLAGRKAHAIEVETFSDALVFCDRPNPLTSGEARFSLQHAVAVTIRDGAPALAAFEPERLASYADLRAVVTLRRDPALTAAYPGHFGARVTVRTEGESMTAEVADAWGDSENPMDEAAVIAKFRRLADWARVPDLLARRICDAALALSDKGPVSDLHLLMHQIARAAGA